MKAGAAETRGGTHLNHTHAILRGCMGAGGWATEDGINTSSLREWGQKGGGRMEQMRTAVIAQEQTIYGRDSATRADCATWQEVSM